MLWKLSDRDMRHYHFLNSICDIGDPPIKGPILGEISTLRDFIELKEWFPSQLGRVFFYQSNLVQNV